MRAKWSQSGLLLAGCLVAGFAGCMTSPYEGQEIATTYTEVSFSGFSRQPGRLILVQAKDDGAWHTIAGATSSRTGYSYYGELWYPWSVTRKIPDSYWVPMDWWDVEYYADVRAVDSAGPILCSFTADFYGFFDPGVSPAEMWEDYGNENEFVRITATNPH